MASRRAVKINPNAMLIGAARRVEMPALPVQIRYDAETDTLYLKFRDDMEVDRTDDDLEKGVIYDYHGRTLVGVEIINASEMT